MCDHRVIYITVKDPTADNEEVGWAVMLDGRVIAVDSHKHTTLMSELADALSNVLDTYREDMEVSSDLDPDEIFEMLDKSKSDGCGCACTGAQDTSTNKAILDTLRFIQTAWKLGLIKTILDEMDMDEDSLRQTVNQLESALGF